MADASDSTNQIDCFIAEQQQRYPQIIDWEQFKKRFYALSLQQRAGLLAGANLVCRELAAGGAAPAAEAFLTDIGDRVANELTKHPNKDPLELMMTSIEHCRSLFVRAHGRTPRALDELAQWWRSRGPPT
jgi:hypothetical protein